MNSGWIKLHRSLLEWEWNNNPHVWIVFTHLLLRANHEDHKWQGIIICQGQVVIGISKFAKEIGLSTKNVRTALDKLKSTSELAIKGTNKYTLVSINNYSKYQQIGEQNGKRTANERRTTGDKQEYKNVRSKEIKNIYIQEISKEGKQILEWYNQYFRKELKTTHGFEKNLQFWLTQGTSMEDIRKSLETASKDSFWKDKMTPMILFRTKDPQGQDVDRISGFLAKEKQKPKPMIADMLRQKENI